MTEQTEREAAELIVRFGLSNNFKLPQFVFDVIWQKSREALVDEAVKKFEALRRQKSSSGVFPLWNMVTLDKAIAILKELSNG